jgi:hypothetical protein
MDGSEKKSKCVGCGKVLRSEEKVRKKCCVERKIR